MEIEKKFKAMVPFRLDGFIISSLSLKQRVGAYYNVINILSSQDQSSKRTCYAPGYFDGMFGL
jgi:hypothetical protein